MRKNKEIFKDSSLSKEELTQYLNGNLSDKEKLSIEKKIASSDFSIDALEGFENTPESLAAFNELSDDFHANLTRKTGSSGKWKFQYSFFIILTLAVIIYFIGSHFLIESEKKREAFDEKRKKEKEEIALEQQKKENEELNIPPVIELSDGEIDSAAFLPKEKQVLSSHVIVESPIKVDVPANEIDSSEIDASIQKAKEIKEKVNIAPVDNIPAESSIDKNVVFNNTSTLYLSELLVVDYSLVYKNGIEKKSIELTGLPASKENIDDSTPNELQVETHVKEISYLDFLREAQEKFRRNKFKDALKDYKIILNQYPNDVNAHFYSGLCYYNINKLNKAIEHFDRAVTHEYNTFQEEANWYKALCLYESGKTAECITLLNKIINAKGFYAEKAAKLLDKI